jgi:hypothetical protein
MAKSLEIGKKMHNYFIVTTNSNPGKSDDKYHRLSFLMSQTWFVYFIDHFGAKNAEFEMKTMNLMPINISLLNHQ